MKNSYLAEKVSNGLKGSQDFWNGTAAIYSSAKLTTEGGEDIDVITSELMGKKIKKMICLGTATGCRDPLVFLESGAVYPEKLVVNDISGKLLEKCRRSLGPYMGNMEVLSVEGAIDESLSRYKNELSGFLGKVEPLFALGTYKYEIFCGKFNSYSALELYSIERENIGNYCSVYPLTFDGRNGRLNVCKEAVIKFDLPISPEKSGV